MPQAPSQPARDDELRVHVERILSSNYELGEELGRGGMGVVYRAKDRRLKRTVAIKILPPELAFRSEIKSRFLREAETSAQLNHPNIVPIYTVDEAEGLVFFVMAFIDGDNLAKRLHDRGVLPLEETRRIVREVADALAYAHERRVVHRDIKPDNILLDATSGRTMVTDFGIARAISEGGDARLTATGMAIGTPAYMSPEQAAGDREIDGRSDLYALGIVAYQMLAGEPPFMAGSTPAMLVKHISERPTPIEQRRTDCPVDLARAVMLLLEKEPANRFPSAAALVAALDSGVIPQRPTASQSPRAEPGHAQAGGALAPRDSAAGYTQPPAEYRYDGLEIYVPTADEMGRWTAPPVEAFRKKLAPYLFVNGAILLVALFGGPNGSSITFFWSIYIAFKYAKLWSNDYDWRDVFRQPRDRELIDVAEESIDWVKGMFNSEKRAEIRARRRERQQLIRSGRGGMIASRSPRPESNRAAALAGPHSERVRDAITDRDQIVRLVESMPKHDREKLPDVVKSAGTLAEKVQALAISLGELDRESAHSGLPVLEAEIERLEGEANPLDRGSEERVHRLAYLKRQRRSLGELARQRGDVAARLDTCAIALRNLHLDLLKLRAGSQTHRHVTSLAMQALELAERVDGALSDDGGGRLGSSARGVSARAR
jgi:eukaryotic-like serine/threonine-protein kinase